MKALTYLKQRAPGASRQGNRNLCQSDSYPKVQHDFVMSTKLPNRVKLYIHAQSLVTPDLTSSPEESCSLRRNSSLFDRAAANFQLVSYLPLGSTKIHWCKSHIDEYRWAHLCCFNFWGMVIFRSDISSNFHLTVPSRWMWKAFPVSTTSFWFLYPFSGWFHIL